MSHHRGNDAYDPELAQLDSVDFGFELTRRSFLHVLGAGIVVTATSESVERATPKSMTFT